MITFYENKQTSWIFVICGFKITKSKDNPPCGQKISPYEGRRERRWVTWFALVMFQNEQILK